MPAGGLQTTYKTELKPGEILNLAVDSIHSIENPADSPSRAIHVYGGNLKAVAPDRTIWKTTTHEEIPYTIDAMLKECIVTLKVANNQIGIDGYLKQYPHLKEFVDNNSETE